MISSKAVNDVKIVPECLLVLSRDKRWLDPIPLAANPVRVILRQKQMVRWYFTRDLDSFLFSSTNHKNLFNKYMYLYQELAEL